MTWAAAAIAADLTVQVTRDMPPLPPSVEAIVARSWRTAQADNPALFNGRIFSADHLSPHRIEGHWTEYRRALAQMNDPTLAPLLDLRPLAVCGVLLCWRDGQPAVLIGKRAPGTSYQQGLWQFPPAGSVDPKSGDPDGLVSPQQALLTELGEEVGLPPDCVRTITPLCVVEHPDTRVTDLGFALHTDLTAETVLAAQATCSDREYTDIHVLGLDQAREQLAAWGDAAVPSAALFLAALTKGAKSYKP